MIRGHQEGGIATRRAVASKALAGKVAVAAGATVYCTGRSVRGSPSPYERPETIEETAELVTAAGGTGVAVRVDHTVDADVRTLLRARRERAGTPRRAHLERGGRRSHARLADSAREGRQGRLQPPYSLLRRDIEARTLPFCQTRDIGARHRRTPGEVAIAWTLRHPAVSGAIVGARRPQQVDEIVGAGTFRLGADDVAELEQLVAGPAPAR